MKMGNIGPGDKESRLLEERKPENLHVHFYAMSKRTKWYLRLLWRPRFSHVSISWRGLLHDFPAGRTPKWHRAEGFLADRPPDLSVALPYSMPLDEQTDILVWIDNCYRDRVASHRRLALWFLGWRRKKKPIFSCATLSSQWIRLLTQYEVSAVTADELFEQIKAYAIGEMDE